MNLMTNHRSKLFCALKQCVKTRRFSYNFPKGSRRVEPVKVVVDKMIGNVGKRTLLHFRKYPSHKLASVLQLSLEVLQAVHENKPIVALESAIITHGMPFPENLQTATSLERIVKENGAIPATVAVIEGQICVGLETHQLNQLAQTEHATKISTRDFPYAAVKRLTGGTTVAATLFASHSAARAITVMATGGIGGVHFDGQNSMDVSADLVEIGRTPMAIVSSGIKSILDLDRTLEYMETLGIGLASFNNSKHLPGFFSEKSGRMAPFDVSSALEAAHVLNNWLNLKLTAGLLFAVPVPKEHSIDEELIKNIIKEANDKARETGLIGQDVTPFLLDRIVTKTSKKSLRTNVALVENNAKIAARIAVEHCRIQSNTRCQSQSANSSNSSSFFIKSDINSTRNCLNSPVVIGGSNVDFLAKMIHDDVQINLSLFRDLAFKDYEGVQLSKFFSNRFP